MSRPLLLVTRPQAELARSMAAAEAAGFEPVPAPLLEIAPRPFSLPPIPPEALLFTSARAPAFVANTLPELRAVPAYAVGANSAAAAQEAGFTVLAIGDDDGSSIVARAAAEGVGSLLHLAGAETAPLQIPQGMHVERVVAYAAEPARELPRAASALLREGRIFAATLFSARSARTFSGLLDAAAIDRAGIRLVTLSPAVSSAAGNGWGTVVTAERPNLQAVMAAARLLWQGDGHG